MVKRALGVLLSLALLAQPWASSASAQALGAPTSSTTALNAAAVPVSPPPAVLLPLSRTAEGLQRLPGRPAPIPKVPNNGVEDFFAVTLISLPFMAFWGLIGALIVGSAGQGHFPPDFDTPLLQGAGMVAAGASVATGLVSVQWGSFPKPTFTPTPQP